MPGYLLGNDNNSITRYELFNEFMQPGTIDLLSRFDFSPDMALLEVGCGIGITACYLAEHIVPDGYVVAFDQSPDLIEHARQRAEKRNVHNVTFICNSAQDVTLDANRFDMAHSRYVLTYIPDAGRVVRKIFGALKPGGIFISEEVTQNYVKAAAYPWYDQIFQWFATLVEHGGGQANYGLDALPADILAAGFENLAIRGYWPVGDVSRVFNMLHIFLEQEVAGILIDRGIAAKQEIDHVLHELKNADGNTFVSLDPAIQVSGRKPV